MVKWEELDPYQAPGNMDYGNLYHVLTDSKGIEGAWSMGQ